MANGEFSCRALTAEDIDNSSQIVFEAFNKFAEETNTPGIPEVAIVRDRLLEYSNDTGIPGKFYGAFLGEQQIGFLMLRKLGIDDEAWEISMLSVSPEYQGNGYAARLVDLALREIIAFKGVLALCAVTDNNPKALAVFASREFESEASDVPVGDMRIWMLRKDMKNFMASMIAKAEAKKDAAKDAEMLAQMRVPEGFGTEEK